MIKPSPLRKMVIIALAIAGWGFAGQWDIQEPQGRQWGQRGDDRRGGPERDRETLERLGKRLSWWAGTPDLGTENGFLIARATELLERTRQSRGSAFQFDRLARATDVLLQAVERVFSSRKALQIDDNDKRDAAEFLQHCYFRVLQAEFFAGMSGEKEAKQYVSYTRSLYQQARSAYDARQYDRAQMLGEASSLIVAALEHVAHASLRIPDPPVIK